MRRFLRELRARNVDRAALAYAGGGWLLAQGGQLVAEAYDWPGWVVRALLGVLMLGFPLVLVLAWFFELTASGLVAESSTAPGSPIRLRSRRKLDVAIAALVIAALIWFATNYEWRSEDHSRPTVTPRSSATLAVLPFKPLHAEARNDALELGMTDTLIARIGSIAEVTVRPLSSVRRYAGLEQDPLEAGRELEVESVLDGSMQSAGDRLRVTVRLLRVADGRQLWSAQFDEPNHDVFAVQDSIATRVIGAMALKLTESDQRRIERFSSWDPEAYHLYVMARGLWSSRRIDDNARAIDYLQRAIARDPNRPLLYAGLAECFTLKAVFGTEPPRAWFEQAKAAVDRALALDPELPEAQLMLAHLTAHYELDWAAAERMFADVIADDPRNAIAHYRLGLLQGFSGRIDDGLAELAIARELEPLWAPAVANTSVFLTFNGQPVEAEAEARRALELDPGFAYGLSALGRALAAQRRTDEALEVFRRRRSPGPGGNADPVLALVTAGRIDAARSELVQLEKRRRTSYLPAIDIALVYAALGEGDAAMTWLDRAVEERSTFAFWPAHPAFDALREDPRFQALLERFRVRVAG